MATKSSVSLRAKQLEAREKIEFLSGVLVVSKDPKRLASFYRDVIGMELEDEEHEGALPHWGCTLGDIHFAIHPIEDFPDKQSGVGSTKLAFTIFDVRAFVKRVEASGVKLICPIKNTGFFLSAMIQDPDGNLLEFTQLCDEWFGILQKRRKSGHDVVQRWKAASSAKK
jgi:predicted enzyme related to lactoylglutathione lyase